ncbi:alpha/beta hydrolase [Pleurocapsa sp. FMAR1]|uniref:alpha/beta hydrolase n=1 Tax=Pleurocapsa sp. FMAR1 TaxID=3040204 RepID=UPI0029C6E202|nr:alpha/beta hydrolase [Pleurocapsa sp. FMAR1]
MPLNCLISHSYISKNLISISLGLSSLILIAQPAFSAEKVKLIYGPFNGKISVESLEKYAATGEMTQELRMYSKFLKKEDLIQLKYWLSNRFESDRVEMYQFTNTPEGEKFLQELGTAIKTHPQRNGFYAIRSSLIGAADNPDQSDGWTVIEAMYKFPTEDLQINTKELFELSKFWSADKQKNQAALDMFAPKAKK